MYKIYTKEGDLGFTSLSNMFKKISKTEFIFDVLGTFDELEVSLGFLHSARLDDVRKVAKEVQKDLFSLGSVISSNERISKESVEKWETRIRN